MEEEDQPACAPCARGLGRLGSLCRENVRISDELERTRNFGSLVPRHRQRGIQILPEERPQAAVSGLH